MGAALRARLSSSKEGAMRRRMLTLALLGALTTLLTMQLTTAAHAVTPFGPTVTVIQPPCADTPVNADAAAGADGKVHGFVNFSGVTCGRTDIWYFEGAGSSWTAVLSPYRGRVLGVANDLTGTYLLYNDGTNTRIAKRAGTAFTSGRPIAAPAQTGDVIASGGKWWAVFTVTRQAPYIGQQLPAHHPRRPAPGLRPLAGAPPERRRGPDLVAGDGRAGRDLA